MERARQAPTGWGNWAMIYHQGLPVAVCPVEAVGSETLKVVCGPLRFERHALLVLQFTSHHEPGRIGARIKGTVEGYDESGMRIRLEPTRS